MKQLLITAVLAIVLSIGSVAQEAPPDAEDAATSDAAPAFPDLAAFVDATIEAGMVAHDSPQATVAIVYDGELIYANGYGIADRETWQPVTADTLFRPGSTSKLFTWTAVMQLVEQGKLDLNADVNTYLETFQIPDTYDEPITLTHVLTHTAGFEEGFLGYLMVFDTADMMSLREALARYIPRRINPPGVYSSYSNYATALAGLIVENVSGMPFNDYIEANILDPLKMENSSFVEPLPADLDANMAVGYKREQGAWAAQDFELIGNFGPAGALSATANDMARFMLAHLNDGELDGARILEAATAQQMHSPLFTPDARLASMAHGFYEQFINGRRLIGHGGDTTLFHTDMLLDKEAGLGIYVSLTTDGGGTARSAFVQAFYDRYFPAPVEPITPPEDFDERAGRYAGAYKFWRHNQSTVEKAFGLGGALQITPTGEGTLLFGGALPPRQFVEIDTNLFRQVDGPLRIAFGEDEDGNVRDLHIDGLPFMDASRVPSAETPFFTGILPAIAFLMFITAWTGWAYRRKEYKAMEGGERTAVRLSLATSGVNLLFAASFLVIFTANQATIFFNIPASMKASLLLADVASLLALGTVYFAVRCWMDGYWRVGRRIHYTLVALSGLFMAWFYYYWNFLGVQLA